MRKAMIIGLLALSACSREITYTTQATNDKQPISTMTFNEFATATPIKSNMEFDYFITKFAIKAKMNIAYGELYCRFLKNKRLVGVDFTNFNDLAENDTISKDMMTTVSEEPDQIICHFKI